jgi:hypothetical protein
MKAALWVFLLVGLVLSGCSGNGAEPGSETDGDPTCSDLFMFWWWPLAAVDEFNDPLPEYVPSEDAWAKIEVAQEAALQVADTEEAWHRALVETWEAAEPESFYATCDVFSDGERRVLMDLSETEASECFQRAAEYYDPNIGSEFGTIARELGVDIPPAAAIDSGQAARVWAANRAEDFIAVCRHLMELRGSSQVDAAPTTSPPPSTAQQAASPSTTTVVTTTAITAPTTTTTTTTTPRTTTTATADFYSISTQGLPPDALAGSGGWWGSGCSPGGDILPDGVWWGYLTDLTPTSVTFDLACLRFADESDDDPATEDYAWVIENNSHKLRVVPVSPVALVTYSWQACRPNPFPYIEWIENDAVPHGDSGREGGLWLYVNDGLVTELGEGTIAG